MDFAQIIKNEVEYEAAMNEIGTLNDGDFVFITRK